MTMTIIPKALLQQDSRGRWQRQFAATTLMRMRCAATLAEPFDIRDVEAVCGQFSSTVRGEVYRWANRGLIEVANDRTGQSGDQYNRRTYRRTARFAEILRLAEAAEQAAAKKATQQSQTPFADAYEARKAALGIATTPAEVI